MMVSPKFTLAAGRAAAAAALRRGALALVGLCTGAASHAGENHSAITVVVTVPAMARLQVISQARSLQISALDLQRGYVDVAEPTKLTVFSTARAGFSLDVLPLSPLVQSIEVHGIGNEAALGAAGGSIVQRWERPQPTALSLTFRLGLAKGIEPGVYAWPLHLSVQPLEDTR